MVKPTPMSNPIDIHVGSRLRMRRIALNFSQAAIGDFLHVTFQQIQKYEKGYNRIGAGRLFELSVILNVPIQYFYDGLANARHRDRMH
jgi:transcriptional regulator with XRE-family HTH domain